MNEGTNSGTNGERSEETNMNDIQNAQEVYTGGTADEIAVPDGASKRADADDISDETDKDAQTETETESGAELSDSTEADSAMETQDRAVAQDNEPDKTNNPDASDKSDKPDISSMTVKEYIEYKKSESDKAGEDIPAWNMLRSQINSGVQLGLPLTRIDIYARPELDYAQREILKYVLYDGVVSDKFLVQLAETAPSADVMRIRVSDEKDVIQMSEAVSTPLRILSESITAYRSDIETYKADTQKKYAEYETHIENLKTQLAEKDRQIQDKDSSLKDLQDLLSSFKQMQSEEQKKERERQAIEERAEARANERFEEMMRKKQEDEALIAMERRKWEAEYMAKTDVKVSKRGRFARKKSAETISESAPMKVVQSPAVDYKVQPLPPDFNLAAYIQSAGLSTGQLEIISLAVRDGVSDSEIKQMIDNRLPAKQMKQVLAVILTRQKRGK